MVNDKVGFIEKTTARTVVATDAGCLMNIGGCLHRRRSPVRFMHLAELLVQT
jgi:L-lactate dehydrogenase complex protein LldE